MDEKILLRCFYSFSILILLVFLLILNSSDLFSSINGIEFSIDLNGLNNSDIHFLFFEILIIVLFFSLKK